MVNGKHNKTKWPFLENTASLREIISCFGKITVSQENNEFLFGLQSISLHKHPAKMTFMQNVKDINGKQVNT